MSSQKVHYDACPLGHMKLEGTVRYLGIEERTPWSWRRKQGCNSARLSWIDRKWRGIIRLTSALGGSSAQIAVIPAWRAARTGHCAVKPPSMGRATPVTKVDLSLARKTTPSATSSGVPIRPIGVREGCQPRARARAGVPFQYQSSRDGPSSLGCHRARR